MRARMVGVVFVLGLVAVPTAQWVDGTSPFALPPPHQDRDLFLEESLDEPLNLLPRHRFQLIPRRP